MVGWSRGCGPTGTAIRGMMRGKVIGAGGVVWGSFIVPSSGPFDA
jgi:hypothetical protein